MPKTRFLGRAGLAAALILVAATAAFAQGPPGGRPPPPDLPPPPINASMSSAELGAALDPWLADLARQGKLNGVVLVARDGSEIFSRGYGLANNETNAAIDADTSFNIASIGKLLTR